LFLNQVTTVKRVQNYSRIACKLETFCFVTIRIIILLALLLTVTSHHKFPQARQSNELHFPSDFNDKSKISGHTVLS